VEVAEKFKTPKTTIAKRARMDVVATGKTSVIYRTRATPIIISAIIAVSKITSPSFLFSLTLGKFLGFAEKSHRQHSSLYVIFMTGFYYNTT